MGGHVQRVVRTFHSNQTFWTGKRSVADLLCFHKDHCTGDVKRLGSALFFHVVFFASLLS